MPSRVHLMLLFQVTHSTPNATLATDQVGFAYLTKTVTNTKKIPISKCIIKRPDESALKLSPSFEAVHPFFKLCQIFISAFLSFN